MSTIGLASMFVALTAAGLVEGFLWRGLAPWEVSLQSVRLMWTFRTATGILILLGYCLFVYNMYMTARTPESEFVQEVRGPLPVAAS